MTATLTVTRGLPGSGKTTWARQQDAWRVNRDDIRAMLRGDWEWGNTDHEIACTSVQHAAIRALLRAELDVVVDDTNLWDEHVEALKRLAWYEDADFRVHDLRDVPLEVCLERNAVRPDAERVPEDVIVRMHELHIAKAPGNACQSTTDSGSGS